MSSPVAPRAWSEDGRTFHGTTGPGSALVPGDLVVLDVPDRPAVLGQLLDKGLPSDEGTPLGGRVVGTVAPDGSPRTGRDAGRLRPFPAAPLRPAGAGVVAALQEATGATLTVGGASLGDEEIAVRLRPAGFNRHTFLCGQSGSGKTYALGVLLEQLLLHTRLRMVVVDPNGDFVRLGEQRPDVDPALAGDLAAQEVRVLRPGPEEGDLSVRLAALSPGALAAVMRLDPLADREEYNLVLRLAGRIVAGDPVDFTRELASAPGGPERALAMRMENLGLVRRQLWATGRTPLDAVVDTRPRATVLDVSRVPYPDEVPLVAVTLLEHLWARREDRDPVLVVIDEAHNVCAAEPADPLQALATQRLVQIAAEGRKYGIWLLLSTQRPSKIHPNVLSQCDNLVLMRMNSPGDLAELRTVFGFAPPSMLAASPAFGQGELLVAGTFTPVPAFGRSAARLTPEGGSDVPVPMPG